MSHLLTSKGILFPDWTGATPDGAQSFGTLEAALAYAAAHPVTPAVDIPGSVPKLAFRKALQRAGHNPSKVVKAIATITDATAQEEALSEWECSTVVSRSGPIVTACASYFGMTAAQMDTVFINSEPKYT